MSARSAFARVGSAQMVLEDLTGDAVGCWPLPRVHDEAAAAGAGAASQTASLPTTPAIPLAAAAASLPHAPATRAAPTSWEELSAALALGGVAMASYSRGGARVAAYAVGDGPGFFVREVRRQLATDAYRPRHHAVSSPLHSACFTRYWACTTAAWLAARASGWWCCETHTDPRTPKGDGVRRRGCGSSIRRCARALVVARVARESDRCPPQVAARLSHSLEAACLEGAGLLVLAWSEASLLFTHAVAWPDASRAPRPAREEATVRVTWDGRSAGGGIGSPTWHRNPQVRWSASRVRALQTDPAVGGSRRNGPPALIAAAAGLAPLFTPALHSAAGARPFGRRRARASLPT